MHDLTKMTHAQLIDELNMLRTRVAELEASRKPDRHPRRRCSLPFNLRVKLQDQIFDNLDAAESLRASEAALRERETQLRLANEAADIGTWYQDIYTHRIHIDTRCRRHFGLDANEVTVNDILACIHPDDRAQCTQTVAAASPSTSDGHYSLEYRVIHADGSIHWLAIRARAHFAESENSARRTVLRIGTSQDITARKQGEELLHRSTERLRTLHLIDQAILEGQSPAQVAMVVVAHLRRLLPCQRATVVMYEAEHSEMQVLAMSSETPALLATDELIELSAADLADLARQPLPWFVSDTLAEPRLAHRTQILGQLGVRAMLNVPLVAQHSLLGTLIVSSSKVDAFSANHLQIAFEVGDQLVIAIHNAQLLAQLKRERSDLARRVADRTVELSAANQELARAAQRKDEFLANMSHELRTPLNTILGRSELLRMQLYGPLNEKQQQGLVAIEESGQHLLSLIGDILDLSKIEAGHVVLESNTVLVNDVCHAALRMVAQVAVQKQLRLISSIDDQVETIIADQRRLKQILVNLLANAVKFTPEGGEVGLSVQGYPENKQVTFTVWDTGIGIAIEDQARLFQPFVQISTSLSREHGGTGLGLALVMRLAQLHGGSVALESSPDAGSRFSVTLPWAPPTVRADALDTAPVMIPKVLGIEDSPMMAEQLRESPQGITAQVAVYERAVGTVEQQPLLLLVDDNQANIDLLMDYVPTAGYQVAVAHNGVEALARVEELQPSLILMDIQMPVLDGLEAIRHIRATGMNHTPIIALTALAMRGDRERCLAAGANAYIPKPVSIHSLLATIAEQLSVP